jgi:hypothetical protein
LGAFLHGTKTRKKILIRPAEKPHGKNSTRESRSASHSARKMHDTKQYVEIFH